MIILFIFIGQFDYIRFIFYNIVKVFVKSFYSGINKVKEALLIYGSNQMTVFYALEKKVREKLSKRDIDKEFSEDLLFTSVYFSQLVYFSPAYIHKRLDFLGPSSVAIYNKNGVQAFFAEFDTFAVVSFKGREADRCQELKTDLKFWPVTYKGCHVHYGFLESLHYVHKRVLMDLEDVSLEKRILYTGHSLGGALCTLLALEYRPTDIVTFGSPKVFYKTDISSYFRGINYRRIIAKNDFVPNLPPDFTKYEHLGEELVIDSPFNMWKSHKLRTYIKGVLKELQGTL